MALFGRKRSPLEMAVASEWTNDQERNQVLAKIRATKLTAEEAARLLPHKDASFRQVAARSWAAIADSNDVMKLVADMRDAPPHARTFMGRTISHVSPPVMEEVVNQLVQPGRDGTGKAGWDLANFIGGHFKLRYLEKAVLEAPPAIRPMALQKLLAEREATEILQLLIQLSRAKDVRLANMALDAACAVNDPQMVAVMVDRLAYGDPQSKQKARSYVDRLKADDLAGLQQGLLDLLTEGDDGVRRLAVAVLLETGREGEVIVRILMYGRDLLGWLRSRIIATLCELGDIIVQVTAQLLAHPDVDVRTAAFGLAEEIEDKRLSAPLCALVNDSDWWLRVTACQVLGARGDAEAVPVLIAALDDEDTRWAAVRALGRIADSRAMQPLARLLRDPREEIRREVVLALANFTDERLLPLLHAVNTKDRSSEIRTHAAEVLRDMGSRLGQEVDVQDSSTIAVDMSEITSPLNKLLAKLRMRGASDLHLAVGDPPFMRMHGKLIRIEGMKPLDDEKIRQSIIPLLSPRQAAILEREGQLDYCHYVQGVGRYRGNVFQQRKGIGATYRVIANTPPTYDQLGLPPQLKEIQDYHQGMIIVSGPTGSGKSTSLSAFVNLLNSTKADHILTLEDPIEFVHPSKRALVNQREIGLHSQSFARSLRAALREDPDIILVGEMRDIETIRLALVAAETGHLVMATLHTPSCVETINRLVAAFPPDEQAQVRTSLSEALKFVMCQALAPRKDGLGRVGVYEVMKCVPSVANLIREGKTHQIYNIMSIGRQVGMQTKDQCLMDLVDGGYIAPEEAWRRAEHKDGFAPMCSHDFLKQMGVIQ